MTFKIEFKDSGLAENAAGMPYSKLLDAKTVAFSADDYLTAFQGLQAMIVLACQGFRRVLGDFRGYGSMPCLLSGTTLL